MSDDRTEEIKKNILSPSQWVRILYMAFYAVACWVLLFVLPVIIVCQVIISLITGADNKNLRDFGAALSAYVHQAINYLVYATDDRAWPFSDGEDLGDIVNDVSDDDSDDGSDDGSDEEKDKDKEDSAPVAAPEASASDDEDVFSDISFTDSADENDYVADADETDDDKDDKDDKDKS